MTDERAIEVSDDVPPEPSGASTGGLATRFVGAPTRTVENASTAGAEVIAAAAKDLPSDRVTAPTDPVTTPTPAVTLPATASLPTVTAPRPPAPQTAPPPVPRAPLPASAEPRRPVPPSPSPAEALPESDAAEAKPKGDGTKWLKAGLVASTVGLCLLMFVGYVYFFANLQQHREQRALLNQYTTADRAQLLSGQALAEGSPAGILSIRALGLTQVVVQGTNATDLLKGPGLMTGTARPGSLGNAVIAGHRTMAGSPFANLAKLHAGDRIEVVTARGAYHYTVRAVGNARPGARDPISPDRHPRLTLVTSGGTAASNGRTYVVASLVSTPNRTAVPRHPPTLAQRGLSGDPAAVLPSILWGLALAAGLVAMFWAYWRFTGRHWSVYLLSTPVLLAVAFLWYENLIRLLPGTV